MDLMDKIKGWTLGSVLKALPFDGGPSSTRTVVLSVNATICLVELGLAFTACWISFRLNAAANLAVIGALLAAMGAIVVPLLGFAMNMQTTRYKMAAQASATSAVVTQTAADGAEKTASLTTGQ